MPRRTILASVIEETPVSPVDVRAYGAVLDGVTDDTAAVARAIGALQDAGGGILSLPSGRIRADFIVTESGITIQGDTNAGTVIVKNSGSAGSYAVDVDLFGKDRPLSFSMYDVTIEGDSAAARTYGGVKLRYVYMPSLARIRFTKIGTCLNGAACYYGDFRQFWFDNYTTGIKGDSSSEAMNANTFTGMHFIEGNVDGTAKPIDGDNLGNNTFIQAALGSSVAESNATCESGTGTTFLNCRWETITSTDHWMTIGNKCRIINPEYSTSVALASGKYIFDVTGYENIIECKLSGTGVTRVVRLESGSKNNTVKVENVQPTGGVQPILDLGLNNRIEIAGGDFMEGNASDASAVSWSDRPISNLITRSIDLNDFTMDGLVKAADADVGPTGKGGVYLVDTPTGNRQMTQSIGTFGANTCFGMSFWAKGVSAGEQTIQACLSESPSGDYENVTITGTCWSRVLLVRKFSAGSFARLFAIRLPVSHGGIYFYGPQVVNLGDNATSGEVSPAFWGGYVPTNVVARTDLQPRDPWRFQRAAPANGVWYLGDRVIDMTCAAAGSSPGLVCVAGGTPGTWASEAVLT